MVDYLLLLLIPQTVAVVLAVRRFRADKPNAGAPADETNPYLPKL